MGGDKQLRCLWLVTSSFVYLLVCLSVCLLFSHAFHPTLRSPYFHCFQSPVVLRVPLESQLVETDRAIEPLRVRGGRRASSFPSFSQIFSPLTSVSVQLGPRLACRSPALCLSFSVGGYALCSSHPLTLGVQIPCCSKSLGPTAGIHV